eukprot:GHUV01050338.1.p1 GENE.GHUV01050338.1~~GHUV01050338.1.p1  ORF type:complete len:229 (+),score=28.94 GHUV01050338.1:462-1148(+)
MQSIAAGLPKPGDVIHVDYRPKAAASPASHVDQDDSQPPTAASAPKPIKLLQWNIERGYQLKRIIQQLREIDADVISLQEVDIGCERSGSQDIGGLIAAALGLNYLFICEFEELRSELRDERSQGGGVHGNAILTKFDISSWSVIEHRWALSRRCLFGFRDPHYAGSYMGNKLLRKNGSDMKPYLWHVFASRVHHQVHYISRFRSRSNIAAPGNSNSSGQDGHYMIRL